MAFKKNKREDHHSKHGAESDETTSGKSGVNSSHVNGVKKGTSITGTSVVPSAQETSSLEDALRDVFAGTSLGLIGEKLIEKNLVTQAQLSVAFEVQHRLGGLLCEALISSGVLSDVALAHAIAESFGFEMAELRRTTIEDDVLALVDESVARDHRAIPLRIEDGQLVVAIAEPSDELRDRLTSLSSMAVRFVVAPLSDIRWAVDTNYRSISQLNDLVHAFQSVEVSRKRPTESNDVVVVGDDAPIVQVVDRILTQAMRDRASDVHIEPSDVVIRVRFRIDGVLKEIIQLPASIGRG
jgi:type IV pilus assembly protein PilB